MWVWLGLGRANDSQSHTSTAKTTLTPTLALTLNPNPNHTLITRRLRMGSCICCAVGPSIQVDPFSLGTVVKLVK